MADNGSTDGAPEEAVERYPNVRLLRTGGNLGYGTAVNRAVAEYGLASSTGYFIVANPDVQWGPRSIDHLLEAMTRWPRAGSLGPLIRDPDGTVYPSARHQPSVIRGGMHAVVGPVWKSNPWTAIYRQEREDPSERAVGMVVRILLVAAERGVGGDLRLRRALLHVHGGRRPGRSARKGRLAKRLRAVGRSVARQGTLHRPRSRPQPGGPPHQHLHFPGG